MTDHQADYPVTFTQMRDIIFYQGALETVDKALEAPEFKHHSLPDGEGARAVIIGPIPIYSDAQPYKGTRELLGWLTRDEFSWSFTQNLKS